jgi:prepilin-type N-terminal cleavage/methylation domain-containing protein
MTVMWMQSNSTARRQGGFTLLELLIALAVMMVGLTALWGLHGAAISSNANAYRLGVGTILAHDAMEQLHTETYTIGYANPDLDLAACGGTFPPAAIDGLEPLPCSLDGLNVRVNGLGNTNNNLGPVLFLRTYHVEYVDPASADRLLLRVRVTYDDPNTGKRHGVTIGATRMADGYDPLNLG